jgi:hypothetical protein
MGKSRIRPEILRSSQYLGRQRDLGLAERIERMAGIQAGGRFCAYHV